MVLSSDAKSREATVGVDPILAITPNGIIAKANLQARRTLGETETLEREELGSLLAHFIAAHDSAQGQLVLSVPSETGELRQVHLVLSDEENPAPLTEHVHPQSILPPEHIASVSVTDFIAHEIRNNISIMMGFSQMLAGGAATMTIAERSSVLQAIEVEGLHALDVVESLLKLAESRRKPEAASTSVPIHSVVRKVLANHRRRHPNRRFLVTGDAPVFANGNSTWIQIAVGNLVSNAEKVTPDGEIIEVNVRQEAERALVIVLDGGKPLASPMYGALWDIYSKGPPKGVEISGSGIGLSLCKELVSAMGGKVWAGPRGRGGSGFAISLHSLPEPTIEDISVG